MTPTNEHTERADLIRKLKRRAMASTNPELSSELMDAAALLEAQREAIAKKDAALKACVDALESLFSGQADLNRAKRCSAAITQAEEALK